MKTIMQLAGITALFILFVACSVEGVKGNGKITTQARQLATFNHIVVDGNYNLMLTAGKTQKVTVTTDSNLLDKITTTVKNNTLTVATNANKSISPSRTPVVTVRLRRLDGIKTSGAVRIQAGNIVAKALNISTSGTSNLSLVGKVDDLTIDTSGSSRINSVGLLAQNVIVNLTGASNIKLYAEKQLNITISGSGNVQYAGNPEVTQKVSGVGKINKLTQPGE